MNPNAGGYFLPYQARWIADPSRLKICEKSRRIGMTYAQSYEDVIDASKQDKPMDIWFSSADESAAKEYIRYCTQWVKLLNIAAQDLGEIVISREDDVKALVIQLATGKRINALSSNPKAFRSKGGKLVLDEFAFHKQPEELWKAAIPVITWGFPARVLSTYNGKGNRYFRMVEAARKIGSRWKLHSTSIVKAVEEGLADRLLGRELDAAGREEWLAECREQAGDEETWQQEYLCNPIDEATAFLPWDLITTGQHEDAGRPELYAGGPCFVGMDIGRRQDFTVIWVIERVGDVLWTREVIGMRKVTFAEQDQALAEVFRKYDIRRLCMDQTGIGEKPVEDAQRRYGTSRVEGILFTGDIKQTLATTGKQRFEDRRVRIPKDKIIEESHHSVRKIMTAAGHPRFDADRSEVGHADHFWAHMLAIHAADTPRAVMEFQTLGMPRSSAGMRDFLGSGSGGRRDTLGF